MGQLAKEWQLMVSAEMVALNGGINACQSSSRKTRVPPPSARSRDGKKYVTADGDIYRLPISRYNGLRALLKFEGFN